MICLIPYLGSKYSFYILYLVSLLAKLCVHYSPSASLISRCSPVILLRGVLKAGKKWSQVEPFPQAWFLVAGFLVVLLHFCPHSCSDV